MTEFVVAFGQKIAPDADDGRLDAPAYHRNHAAIQDVLTRFLSEAIGDVVEIGSGTGQHAVTFAAALPALTWQPSDPNPAHCDSIEAWRRHAGLANVIAPLALDVTTADWRDGGMQTLPGELVAIISLNMLHISPWSAGQGLLEGAGRRLRTGGHLFIYGAFTRDGAHISESNASFDASLRSQNPAWGVRDIADVGAEAGNHGLRLSDAVEMPNNNFMLVFVRQG